MAYALHETNVGANIRGHTINNLRFADYIALIAETLVDKVHHSSSTLGLKINVNNTEVQNISTEPKHIHIMIDDMACLRKILGITRMDKVRNTTIRTQLNIKRTVINQICQKRLRYFWHIERMPVTRFPRLLWKRELKETDQEGDHLRDGQTV